MKKKDIITIIVLLVIFGIIFLIALLNKDPEEEIKTKTEFKELTLLTDEDMFLSVSNNISKSFEYATGIIINDNNYQGMTFKAEEIYVVSRANIYKYFVEGDLYRPTENSSDYEKDGYFILNYDINKRIYNVEVIDEDRYKNAKEEEYEFKKIESNNNNKFEYITLNNKNRASMYFNDFIEKMYLETEEAYNLLSNDTKERYFNTLEDFEKFIKKHSNITLKEYGVNNNQIGIVDNNNVEYVFDIKYVLKYNVTINKTEE